jgi:hypothetical protein
LQDWEIARLLVGLHYLTNTMDNTVVNGDGKSSDERGLLHALRPQPVAAPTSACFSFRLARLHANYLERRKGS